MPPLVQYRRSESVDASVVDDRVILYECQSRHAVVLNPTGTWLWEFLKTPQSVSQLVSLLQNRFSGLEAAQAQRDVETYLQELLEQKLIRVAN